MLKNYFNITLRNLWRNKVNTFINLLGLSLGVACCLLIVLYVQHELSYDKYHTQADRIYRLSNEMNLTGEPNHIAVVGLAPGPTMVADFPEVLAQVRFMSAGNRTTVRYDDKLFNENGFFFSDTTVFDILTWPLLSGNPQTALSRPRTVVLNETLVHKYFGDEDPIGKQIRFNTNDYEVTGVMQDIPENSGFRPNALLSFSTIPQNVVDRISQDWMRMTCFTYLLFDRPENGALFVDKLDAFAETYTKPWLEQNSVSGYLKYHITALSDLHLRTDMSYDVPKGNKAYLYIFSIVAVFILLIACINYINLAIAQSTQRSLEVGIRKTTGALQHQLVTQFIGESLLLSLFALALGIIFVELALPVFNSLADKSFAFRDVFSPTLLLSMFGIMLFVGIAAGSYPALYLSSLKPIDVLKGSVPKSGRQILRKSLVVVQFCISIGLIISTLIVYGQMGYLKDHDLGFDKEQVMILEVPSDTLVTRKLPQIKAEMMENPAVVKTATASGNSIPGSTTGTLLFRVETEVELEEKGVAFMAIDEDYLDLLGIELLEGRNFERSRQTDPQQAFIVNEALVEAQGWEKALDKRVQWGLMANDSASNDGRVVGVIKNFHFASLHNEIDPLIFLFSPNTPSRLFVKLSGQQLTQGIDFVKAKWSEFDPNHPLEYSFLDESFDQQYQQEEKMMAIFGYFTVLTILIACMGLFGLSAFITQQRTKEIGIRKVLGAENSQILYLLSKDFFLLILIALVLASGGAWYGMAQWLEGFAYHTSIHWYYFLLAGFGALLIAFLTTSFHALRAAKSNPVEALKYE